MDYLKLNVEAIEQDFDLPFKIISGYVRQLSIDIPWYKIRFSIPIKVKEIGNFYSFYHVYTDCMTIRN